MAKKVRKRKGEGGRRPVIGGVALSVVVLIGLSILLLFGAEHQHESTDDPAAEALIFVFIPVMLVENGESTESIYATVKRGELRHGGNPVLRWCVDNLVMVPDANENIRPVKDKSTDRIDLFVAMLIAWTRALPNMAEGGSPYEDGGIFTF